MVECIEQYLSDMREKIKRLGDRMRSVIKRRKNQKTNAVVGIRNE